MKLTPNDIAKIQSLCSYYSKMYLDAFVASEQCHSLESLTNTGPSNIGFLEPSKAGPSNDPSELLVLKCFLNWEENGRNFNLPQEYCSPEWKYKYRDIQKDSLRCFLIYIPIQIIRHLNQLKKDAINKDELAVYIVTKIKLLRFGCRMLNGNDLHIL